MIKAFVVKHKVTPGAEGRGVAGAGGNWVGFFELMEGGREVGGMVGWLEG